MFFRLLLFTSFMCAVVTGFSQQELAVRKDLREAWIQQAEGGTNTVYFPVEASQFPGCYLQVGHYKPYFLFINGKLARKSSGALLLPLDSLASVWGPSMIFGVYQPGLNRASFNAAILTRGKTGEATDDWSRPGRSFHDYIVSVGLAMILYFVIMITAHPKLASDYFSLRRILSVREGDDNLAHARISLSANVLFYVFNSLLIGYLFIVIARGLPSDYALRGLEASSSFGVAVWNWIKVSMFILLIMFAKLILVFGLSFLFGMRAVAGIHFFNWVRLLLLVASTLAVVIFIYFITTGRNASVYEFFLILIVAAMIAWIVILFLKLGSKTDHSMFHLFSYICATEVIPLLITIRVLFQ